VAAASVESCQTNFSQILALVWENLCWSWRQRGFRNLFSERGVFRNSLSDEGQRAFDTTVSLAASAAISFEANLAPKVLTNQPVCVCVWEVEERKTHYFLRPWGCARRVKSVTNTLSWFLISAWRIQMFQIGRTGLLTRASLLCAPTICQKYLLSRMLRAAARCGEITNECELGAQCFSRCTKWSHSGCCASEYSFLVFFRIWGALSKEQRRRKFAGALFKSPICVFAAERKLLIPDPSRAKFVLKSLEEASRTAETHSLARI
jgi:hypothetical protein